MVEHARRHAAEDEALHGAPTVRPDHDHSSISVGGNRADLARRVAATDERQRGYAGLPRLLSGLLDDFLRLLTPDPVEVRHDRCEAHDGRLERDGPARDDEESEEQPS